MTDNCRLHRLWNHVNPAKIQADLLIWSLSSKQEKFYDTKHPLSLLSPFIFEQEVVIEIRKIDQS